MAIPAKPDKKFSNEVLSVLLIMSADFYLQESTRQHINVADKAINWSALFKLPLSEAHKAALIWAYCIWNEEIPSGMNPFAVATAMGPELQRAILEALKFRWGNPK